LRLYIESRFGAAHGGNLWDDKLDEITQLAKARGVRVENVSGKWQNRIRHFG